MCGSIVIANFNLAFNTFFALTAARISSISPLRIDDLCNCGKGYVSSVFTSYLTNFRRYLDIDDVGTDYVLNPTSGDWEQRYLLSPHIEPKKENDHDESEQQ